MGEQGRGEDAVQTRLVQAQCQDHVTDDLRECLSASSDSPEMVLAGVIEW